MANNFSDKEVEHLKNLGFKPTFPGKEKEEYCLYEKNIRNHPLLKGLRLTVDEDTIAIWCNSATSWKTKCLIAERPFSQQELESTLSYLLRT